MVEFNLCVARGFVFDVQGSEQIPTRLWPAFIRQSLLVGARLMILKFLTGLLACGFIDHQAWKTY